MTTMLASGTPSAFVDPPLPRGDQRLTIGRWAGTIGRALVYTFVALVLAVTGFSVVLALLALGAGTVVIWIGLPILVAAVMTARGFAAADRALHRGLLGSALPTPAPRAAPEGAGWTRRLLTPLADPQSWMNCLFLAVQLVLTCLTFPVMITWLLGAIGTVGGPLAMLILRQVLPEGELGGTAGLFGIHGDLGFALDLAGQVVAGLIFLVTLHPMAGFVTGVHRSVSRALLSSRYDEQQQLARTEASLAAGRTAESDSLRRLERDLHDGPQQGLVRAGMDLARAERLATEDPEKAQAILRETRALLGGTLDEVRRLSRGIAPPILADRGLPAALAQLAGTSPIPATVLCPVLDLPVHVETGVYYVVSESLANAAKHSRASAVQVSVERVEDQVRVRIQDDGVGGAQIRAGHGLAGLAGRVASLQGILEVVSPAGSGTRVEAVIPCGS